ncbi:hypothetical protein RJ640_013476 [Escallonia rubra]|uniref:Cytochrome P450 n=1 Tax=Escallonia rubra TaxID=112253 RepID=A0AA88R1N1_9ASTE|nr:hypothetical protein RJ640_013476 [Escallonia rubra]
MSQVLLTTDENRRVLNELNVARHLFGVVDGSYSSIASALTFIIKYLSELPHVYDEVLREQTEIANSKEQHEMLAWEDIRKMKYFWNVS